MENSVNDRLRRLEQQLCRLQDYSIAAFWTAMDRVYEATLDQRELTCIVCGLAGRRSAFTILTDECIFNGGQLERYQCRGCDAVFGPQKCLDLAQEFVDMDYTLLYSRYQEAVSTDNEVRTFYSLNPKLEGVYLNWGCGTGNQTISLLRSEGYDVWGFEPSGHASGPFVVSNRSEISARFDGIFSNNVIEHFRQPQDQFEEFRHFLKPSALMAHSSPCYEYAYAFTRFHTLFLIGRSADVLSERTGFRVKHREKDGEYINVVFELLENQV